MFNVSWAELAVLAGVSLAVIGRKDLPKVAYVAGTQIGRLVGFLQGTFTVRTKRWIYSSEYV
jgi:Sec-independent protein translocase protein TatA